MNNVLTRLNCDTRYGSSVHVILHLRHQQGHRRHDWVELVIGGLCCEAARVRLPTLPIVYPVRGVDDKLEHLHIVLGQGNHSGIISNDYGMSRWRDEILGK